MREAGGYSRVWCMKGTTGLNNSYAGPPPQRFAMLDPVGGNVIFFPHAT